MDSTCNGQFSINADEGRNQLRNQLKDRLCVLDKSHGYWSEILSASAVSVGHVHDIAQTIQVDVDILCELAEAPNPVEEFMYQPLARILNAITAGDHTTAPQQRFWKDHHTKYPGVDPDVLMSGLGGDSDGADGVSTTATSSGAAVASRRRRVGNQRYIPVSFDGTAQGDEENNAQIDDSEYKHKIPKTAGAIQQVVDARKPDWILLDANSEGKMPANVLWRQIAVIFELKASNSFVPKKWSTASSLLVQCTDYARLHLALRPFQRFSIQVSLCGTLFTAFLVDRSGVIISDTVDISTPDGLSTFIRTLVQVTTDLTMYELGMDPTVSLEGGCLGDISMPRIAVTMPSGNVYLTKGPQIWQSSSLFGRGTVIWNVETKSIFDDTGPTKASLDVQPGAESAPSHTPQDSPLMILKCAYRHHERIGESKFYTAIRSANPTGVAGFLEGGDVTYNGELLTNARHRQSVATPSNEPVAHRLVLKSKGRRLSEYKTFLELLEAVLASVKGHESLFNRGIIHRDISIGNVFISDDPIKSGTAGFLGDLDMAKVYDEKRLAELIGEKEASALVRTTNSGSITGTAQFMSLRLLEHNAALHKDQVIFQPDEDPDWVGEWGLFKKSKLAPIQPSVSNIEGISESGGVIDSAALSSTAIEAPPEQRPADSIGIDWEASTRDDLESFIWVILYALCVKEMNSRPASKGIGGREWYCRTQFVPVFGDVSFEKTYNNHCWVAKAMVHKDSMSVWKKALLSKRRYWTLFRDLMRCAEEKELNHAIFQECLEFYIDQEKSLITRSE